MRRPLTICVVCWFIPFLVSAAEFRGRVVDRATGVTLPARVYLRNAAGDWLFVESAAPAGSALPYREQWVPMPNSIERHTTISADPFRIELPPGEYELEIERGKEYFPLQEKLVITDRDQERTFALQRWINLAERGWYSGETHVHRRLVELPNVMRAEDLNVAFPVTFWTIRSDAPPDLEPSPLRRQGPSPFGPREDRGTAPIPVDSEHVIFPRNTEYEIFSVAGRSHVLGAIFLLNHKSVFRETAPPIGRIAAQARAEGALLDLDKHSWPWSLMLVPVARVDLFELANNSVWRTQFGFRSLSQPLPPWAEFEMDGPQALTEWGWLNYGFEFYYGLLNCGFRLAPTAGTASGVHPVPLGYSRVYVHTGRPFDANNWLEGLRRGRSFVTTGPMLFATLNEALPGQEFTLANAPTVSALEIEAVSDKPLARIEVLRDGEVVATLNPVAARTEAGAWRVVTRHEVSIERSGWIAVRIVEPQPDGRQRFAHSAPWYLNVANRPAAVRRDQVEYFIRLLEMEIERNRNVLQPEAQAEFEQALAHYRGLLAE